MTRPGMGSEKHPVNQAVGCHQCISAEFTCFISPVRSFSNRAEFPLPGIGNLIQKGGNSVSGAVQIHGPLWGIIHPLQHIAAPQFFVVARINRGLWNEIKSGDFPLLTGQRVLDALFPWV